MLPGFAGLGLKELEDRDGATSLSHCHPETRALWDELLTLLMVFVPEKCAILSEYHSWVQQVVYPRTLRHIHQEWWHLEQSGTWSEDPIIPNKLVGSPLFQRDFPQLGHHHGRLGAKER